LTTISDTNLQRALGRVLIKPYLNTEDKKDVVLYAELKTYGSIPNPQKFMDEVDDYMEKTQQLSGSYERLGCLYPDSDRDTIEGKETIRTRALKKFENGEELEDSEFISLPLEIKRKSIDDFIKNNLELYGYIIPIKYSYASQSQKKNIIKTFIKNKERIYPFLFNGAPKDSKKEIIDKQKQKMSSSSKDESEDEDDAEDDFNDALKKYYRLKNEYEESLNDNKKKIMNSAGLSLKEKRIEFHKLKRKCVNCKRPVGTIFNTKFSNDETSYIIKKDRHLIALCGDRDDPCPLNIDINLGATDDIRNIVIKYEKELNEFKNKIIIDKNELLFGYITSNIAVEKFEENSLEHYIKKYLDSKIIRTKRLTSIILFFGDKIHVMILKGKKWFKAESEDAEMPTKDFNKLKQHINKGPIQIKKSSKELPYTHKYIHHLAKQDSREGQKEEDAESACIEDLVDLRPSIWSFLHVVQHFE
jgi:hypothetical protein